MKARSSESRVAREALPQPADSAPLLSNAALADPLKIHENQWHRTQTDADTHIKRQCVQEGADPMNQVGDGEGSNAAGGRGGGGPQRPRRACRHTIKLWRALAEGVESVGGSPRGGDSAAGSAGVDAAVDEHEPWGVLGPRVGTRVWVGDWVAHLVSGAMSLVRPGDGGGGSCGSRQRTVSQFRWCAVVRMS